MSACIGTTNSQSNKDSQFNFDSQAHFTIGEKRKRARLQQRSNSQIFVPIKKDKDFSIFNSNESNNQNKSDEKIIDQNKIKDMQKVINKNFIINNKEKKTKLRGKSNVCIKKKVLSNIDEDLDLDIIDCEEEFDFDKNINNSIKNADILSGKRVNYLPKLNPLPNNLRNIKINNSKKENGKENENENENNSNGILNDSYNNKDLNMELSVSKNKITINDNQRSTIFGNLINNEENGGKTLENENNNKKEIIKDNRDNRDIKEKKENKKKIENKIEENKNDENKLLVIKDYYDGGITILKGISSNNNIFKITKANNISFAEKKEEIIEIKDIKNNDNKNYNNKNINNKNSLKEINKSISDKTMQNSTIKKPNKSNKKNVKNIDFNNCKIDNNINFNIENNNLKNNNVNNANNMNNINNFNNISSINIDPNNNNFNDISSNMTYFLSLEKSQRKPTSSRFEGKISSLRKNNHVNSVGSDCGNNYRNSVRVNKYKWKLLPKHKYNTQIYKSLNNIPLSRESQSLFMNEDDQKNLNLTWKNNNNENNAVLSEIKRGKEQQDKIIKSLENKIKNLENKINEEKTKEEQNNIKISQFEEYIDNTHIKKNFYKKMIKESLIVDNTNSSNNNNNEEALKENQKDFKIKKLEEQLNIVKKNNKLNKTLLKQKDKQIQNLLHTKTKQDERIKQYEYLKYASAKINNNFYQNKTAKGNKKIHLLDDISNITSNNNNGTNTNSNNNLSESKISLSDLRNNKNLNTTTNLKINRYKSRDLIDVKENIKQAQKKDNSFIIQKHFFKYNTSNYSENFGIDQEQMNLRGSMKEMNKLKLNKNSNVKNNSKYNLSNKSTSSISYYNYCNDLYNKSKNNYSTKITMNKMKIYKLNNSLNLTLNSDSRINKYFKQPNKGIKQGIKEEMNLEMNMIPNTTKTTRKKFSFNKTKKLSKKNSEKNFREMYLREGTVKNEESNSNNNNSSTLNNDNNEVKLFSYNDIILLKHKTYLSKNNNNNNDELNNKNNNNNNVHNLSLSPNLLPSNYPAKINHNGNITLEDQINLSQSINNIHILNPNSNEQKDEINKIYKKHWNEGYKRYKQLIGNKENEENLLSNLNNNLLKLNFCMANELFEIIVNKEELMEDIKNKFFQLFFEKKYYGDTEKKYIIENILFLKEDGIIDINKNIRDNNLENNEIIIPVLKDSTL